MKLLRRLPYLAAVAALALCPAARAAEITLKWDTNRTTSPETIEELRALEARVKAVPKKALPSTVGLLVGNGAGSGVIVSEDGLVLTAAHVIDWPRQKITFVLSDGKEVEGVSLGINRNADSGIAKITGKPPKDATWPGAKEGKWPVMELGVSKDLPVGGWVVAMGHPGGPKPERPPPVRLGRVLIQNKYISTGCTLVGGDSGGPLYDLDGKVIGIHSQIGFTLDMNMHVPVDKFQTDWARLVRGDAVGEKWGLMGVDVEDDKTVKGARISKISEGGAAAKADLEVGDVVTKFNGLPVKVRNDFIDIMSSYEKDEKVKITYLRDGEENTVTVTLGGTKRTPRNR